MLYYSNYYNEKQSNVKAMWQQINLVLGRKFSCATNVQLNPNNVNSFFANLGPDTVKNLSLPAFTHTRFVHAIPNTFYCNEMTLDELLNVVISLPRKTSSGFVGLSTKNLKLILPVISSTVSKIVNKSFNAGIFPDILKIARVISIHKRGDGYKQNHKFSSNIYSCLLFQKSLNVS